MPKKSKKLSKEIVNYWPEVFEDIEIQSVPIEYLRGINVHFIDGKVWEIELDRKKIGPDNVEVLEEELDALFEEYEDSIETIDFKLDTEKVKKDISLRTKRFLKKRK